MYTSDSQKQAWQSAMDKTNAENAINEQIKTAVANELRKALRPLEERIATLESKLNITS
jgi:hypothetical protein